MSTDIKAMTSLATRLEQAGPESQAELLREAYEAIFGFSPKHDEWYGIEPEQRAQGRYFTAMLDCGAYLSAAEMLVTDGAHFGCGFDAPRNGNRTYSWGWVRLAGCQSYFTSPRQDGFKRLEPTPYAPALALAAACVRAAIAGKES